MPVTLLDLIVIGVILISALLAMVRGFTREVLSIAAWVAAAVAVYFLRHHVVGYVKPYIQKDLLAQIVAGGAIFLVTLIIVSFITIRISDMILDSRIGAIDRTLGFLFGAARGFLLVVVAFLFFSELVKESLQPTWVTQAKSRDVLTKSGTWLMGLLPEDVLATITDKLKANDILPPDSTPSEPDQDAAPTTPAPAPQPGQPAPQPQ